MSISAGGVGGKSTVDPKKPFALGLVGGLLGIYLTPINPILGPLFAALGAVCAIIWGSEALSRVAGYGLASGIPSIVYMSLAISIAGTLSGLAGILIFGSVYTFAGPVMGFVISMIMGAIIAIVSKKVLRMKIPILIQCSTELAGASALSVLGFSAAIAGSYALPVIQQSVISTGFIALLFILNTMAIQHPFNACFGPNEDRKRTLKLAFSTAFISMAIIGVISVGTNPAWWLISIIGAIGWFISIRAFINASKDAAASVKWSGLWPEEE